MLTGKIDYERTRPLKELALIFRAQRGDHEAQETVTLAEALDYLPARTFAQFLEVNGMPAYEEVLR